MDVIDTRYIILRYQYKGSLDIKKTVKKGNNVTLGEGRVTASTFFSPNLPGPQITWKWTMHTDKLSTKCHLWAYLQAGCRIWDWQSTIVKDLNDSQEP